MSGWLFLIVSAVGALFTASALVRPRRPRYSAFPWFVAGWLTGELALHHLAWQALATLAFAIAGALATWPGIVGLALTLGSWGGLLVAHGRALGAASAVRAALAANGSPAPESSVPLGQLLSPLRVRRPDVARFANVAYGERLAGDRGRRNLLDVVGPAAPGSRRPALLQIHGGAWVVGEKEQQGQPLMYHLAARGWVCFAPNYRLSPRASFPDHIVDVKRAIAWLREHADEYGADPDLLCITGGSAGGHLAALAALSAGDPSYQPGFEAADTRVSACVPFYGVYDLLDRHGLRAEGSIVPFLERRVLKCSPHQSRAIWENASPIARVHPAAPPFLVIHGTHDSLVPVDEARAFVAALREKSRSPVHYLELEGAQHAFDLFHSLRCTHALHAVTAFLEGVRAGRVGVADPPAAPA